MSKKVNTTTIEAATTATTTTIKTYFEQYPNVSIRKLADATGINYGILLKKSKQPIAGEAYDPDATNWDAIAQKLTEKQINVAELDWEALNEKAARKAGKMAKSTDDFEVGSKVFLRREPTTPYTVLYKTETHIVIMLDGTSEPIAWSNNTFILSGPMHEARTVQEQA